MARSEVLIKRSAVKEIESIPRKKDRQRVVGKIRQLAENPRPPACRRLSGHDRFRIRHGSYRIVYADEDDRLIVYVVEVGHLRDVYRGAL